MVYKRISLPIPAAVALTLHADQVRAEELFDRILFGRTTPTPETFNDPRKAGALKHLSTVWVMDHPEAYAALPKITQFIFDAAILDLGILEKKNEPDLAKRPSAADLDDATKNIVSLVDAELKPYIDALRAGTDTVPGYIKIQDLFDDWVTSGMRDWFFTNLHVLTGVFQKKPTPPAAPPGTPPPAVGWEEWLREKGGASSVIALAGSGAVISGVLLATVTVVTLVLMVIFWVGHKIWNGFTWAGDKISHAFNPSATTTGTPATAAGTPATAGKGLTLPKVGAGLVIFFLAIGPLPVFALSALGVIVMVGYFMWPFYHPSAFIFMACLLTAWLMRLFLVVSDQLIAVINGGEATPAPASSKATTHSTHTP